MARSRDGMLWIARMLGVFSVGLGIAQLLAPDKVDRFVGLRSTPRSRRAMRMVGAQELAVGAGLLSGRATRALLWTRVLGDLGHLGLLWTASRHARWGRDRMHTAMAGVAGAAVVDAIAASQAVPGSYSHREIRARATVTINRDPQTVYRWWRDLERLPEFMTHVRSVDQVAPDRSHWEVDGPGGTTIVWDAEIIQDVPGELLAWRSVAGSDVPNSGVVHFTPAPGDRGTEVTVELEFEPPAGAVGSAVAKLLGEHPDQQARDDLRRFKQILEAGEVIRTDGSPEGMRSQRLLMQEPAQPSA